MSMNISMRKKMMKKRRVMGCKYPSGCKKEGGGDDECGLDIRELHRVFFCVCGLCSR